MEKEYLIEGEILEKDLSKFHPGEPGLYFMNLVRKGTKVHKYVAHIAVDNIGLIKVMSAPEVRVTKIKLWGTGDSTNRKVLRRLEIIVFQKVSATLTKKEEDSNVGTN